MTEGRGKVHNEELHTSYSSKILLWCSKSKAMRLTGHVAALEL
jgi:hypothetical protein